MTSESDVSESWLSRSPSEFEGSDSREEEETSQILAGFLNGTRERLDGERLDGSDNSDDKEPSKRHPPSAIAVFVFLIIIQHGD
jgi:hypothetical protein